MFSHVDGSMATAPRSRRMGGHTMPAREGVPAVLAPRRCRTDEAKRSGGNTGNTGNPLPPSGVPNSSMMSGASVYAPAAGLRRMGWRKWAETTGNPVQKICSRCCPYFYCLTFGVHYISLAETASAQALKRGR